MGKTAGFPGTTWCFALGLLLDKFKASTHTSWTEKLCQVSTELENKKR